MGRAGRKTIRTQVAIIGSGPAGLFLAHLLHQAKIDAVVLEHRNRDYVEGRVRAGVLEQTTVDLMDRLGLASRMRREGLIHEGVNFAYDEELFRVDLAAGSGRPGVTVYGQQEIMKDLFDAAADRGLQIIFDVSDVQICDVTSEQPCVTWREAGGERRLDCDVVVGCDGFHGVSRSSIPASVLRTFERVYPFGWLGVLADVPPPNRELIYCNHEHGFALASMRSATRSRCYIQCALDERLEDWSDERFWDEFTLRLGDRAAGTFKPGPCFEKSIAPLRSFVAEPMRYGNLFLAGDAAHIVPPTGAKGLNLAVSDVITLAGGLEELFCERSTSGVDDYSRSALSRVWKAERFSWWFTSLTHRFPGMGPLERRLQKAELDYLHTSSAAQASFAENYVGLPLEMDRIRASAPADHVLMRKGMT